MALFNPPKPSQDKSPIWVWLAYLVQWMTSERVYIQGWNVTQKADGKYFIPPPQKLSPLIYNFPFRIQKSPPGGTAGTTYYRVRSGTLNLLTCANSDGDPAVTGYVTNPDDTTQYPAYSAICDFEVASDVITYFWIDNTTPTAPRIDADSTPPGGNTTWNTTTGWADGNYILVGWINWTSATPWIRQIVRTDLFCIPST